ncbi:protein DENND6B-like [Acyrthosiphon pisum]|uniref:Uncharacterized protein n=1 Tax=Acyrthosiphon pisum TaxID=7029 RepID=A0A8R2H3T5_ACYPI|nr:protein DENND6B-like [Acyrthosiphon pisum]|eukprot:XP_016658042.1 PREDICTED: protein DENND6B-like [Acyrthosiphon pisum]
MVEHGVIDTNIKHDKPADEMLSDCIQCICVVTFLLVFGQAMELLLWLPTLICRLAIFWSTKIIDIKSSEEDKTNLCYLEFPDSNSGCMGALNLMSR